MDEKRLQFFLLTPEQHAKIVAYQGGCCGICGRKLEGPHSKVLDHDHVTGLVRGELCWLCNKALGFFQDSVLLLAAATHYLNAPPATAALGIPHLGLPGRVGTKRQRKMLRKLKKNLQTATASLNNSR